MGFVKSDQYELEIKKTGTDLVQLTLDMREFCRGVREYLILKVHITEMRSHKPDALLQEELNEFEGVKKNFEEEKKKLSCLIEEWRGNLYWEEIKKLLRDSSNARTAEQQATWASALPLIQTTRSGFTHVRPSLLVETLDMSFLELLKNSIDACLKKFLALIDDPECLATELENLGHLKVNISMQVESDQIRFEMTDNGSGFPQDFLENMESYVSAEKTEATLLSEKDENECFLGGNARALRILVHMLRGEKLESGSLNVPVYEVEKGSTNYIFQNAESGGAQVILTGPLAPFPEVTPESTIELRLPKHFFTRKRAGSEDSADPAFLEKRPKPGSSG